MSEPEPAENQTVVTLDDESDNEDTGPSTSAEVPPSKRQKTDPIWDFFTLDAAEPSKALCKICNKKISRGGTGKGATSSSMKSHLTLHPIEYSAYQRQKSTKGASQPTIKEAFSGQKKWDITDKNAIEFHYLIGEMIALDCQPLQFVENVGFKRLMTHAVRKYRVPRRDFFTTKIIPDIYEKCKISVKKKLSNVVSVSFTTDIWTAHYSNESFLSLTAHWISKDYRYEYSILNTSHLPGSHTGTSIANKLNELLINWEIVPEKMHITVRDNAENMVKGLKDGGFPNEACFIHTLQLAIKDAIKSQRTVNDTIAVARNIATHFNHSSLACSRLKGIQKQLSMEEHKIIQDVQTRWNSTYYMLKRLVEQRDSITLFAGQGHITNLTENQWGLAASTLALLQPFEEVTKMISQSESMISEVIPAVVILSRYLEKENLEMHFGVGTLKNELKRAIESRFNGIFRNVNYTTATFLDPRFKLVYFSEFQQQFVRTELLKLILIGLPPTEPEIVSTDQAEPLDLSNKVHSAFWDCDEELRACVKANSGSAQAAGLTESTVNQEIEYYISITPISRKENPLTWWREKGKRFPNLNGLVFKYLSSPASTVFSERLFSTEGSIYEDKRNRLLPGNGEMLAFINRNLPLLNFKY